MCGRFRCALDPTGLETATGVPRERWDTSMQTWAPKNNVTPGTATPVMKLGEGNKADVMLMT